MLKFEIVWEKTLDSDLQEVIKKINAQIPKALQVVGAEMTKSLVKHIQRDVYDAYTPISYPRRGYNGGLIGQAQDTDAEVKGNELSFVYLPRGDHPGKMSDTLNYYRLPPSAQPAADEPLKPFPVHGDDLIRRIETGHGYDWDCDPGERPFWKNFVDEQANGEIMLHFVSGMSPYKVTEDGKGKDIVLDGTEYVR